MTRWTLAGRRSCATLGGGEFSIGRGPENNWVLADPDRHLSKRHCVLAFRAGGWQLADTSTNGTFLNRESEAVGPGRPRRTRIGLQQDPGMLERAGGDPPGVGQRHIQDLLEGQRGVDRRGDGQKQGRTVACAAFVVARDHFETGTGVIGAIHPGKRKKVRHLPEK